FGVGSYTWSFSAPVMAIRLHLEAITATDDISVLINGVPYIITPANVTPLLSSSTCLGATGTAVAFGGDLVNSGGGSNSATLDINPGYGIISVTVQSNSVGTGVMNDFTFALNSAPVFVQRSVQLFSVCESSAPFNINSILAVADADTAQSLTWTVSTAPLHGTAGGFPTTITSTGGIVTPSGLTYTPTTGFSGFDTIIVQISDGISAAMDTLVVTVNPTPTLSGSPIIPAVCSGSLVSYIPASPIAGTIFNWNRPFVGGISNAAASGTGNPNEILDNITYYSVNVAYIYTLMANGCNNTQIVTVTIKPTPALSSPLYDTICNGETLNYIPASATAGTVFTWSRASVAGISPATSSGADSIHEALTNSTSALVNTIYRFGLNANGCTSLRDVTVTVKPPVPGPPITTMPPSSLCGGTVYQNFGTSVVPGTGVSYSWSAVNATIMATGANGQYALISFNTPGNAVITLTSTIPGSPCLSASAYDVTVSPGENPSAAIIYYDYQFIYLDNTADSYQWGYDDATSLEPTFIAGAEFQSYPNSYPDFTGRYYWVMTTKYGCTQKTYYNGPLAVHNIQQGNNIQGLKIFPNPAGTSVTISINAQQGSITEVSLTDMLGQTIKTRSGSGHNFQFNIADLPAGFYLVSCTQNGVKIATGRLIKN
ncbi:MAG: T9SS type A sorting domain-containing protein, partial [Chitinophagales bacterium]